ncbi:MAG: dihydrodipicolinate synthase family protein [Spirochaetales bacterium]
MYNFPMITLQVQSRKEVGKAFFPFGIPRLWCPPLTHYRQNGSLDTERIGAHLKYLKEYVKTYLLFGSTSDGWELSEQDMAELLDFLIFQATKLEIRLLIGVLKTDADLARRKIVQIVGTLKEKCGTSDPEQAFSESRICGFAVCAPKGKHLTPAYIRQKLFEILDLGYPTTLYQLPQVTENEIDTETFAFLADGFPNFYLFKDASGTDTIIRSKIDRRGIFMMRGSEGDYHKWYPAEPGGLYDGFLLSSANCFAPQLNQIIELKEQKKNEEAELLSIKISRVIRDGLSWAQKIPFGNSYANLNKAFDHFFAYGKAAFHFPPPMTYSGNSLPEEFLLYVGDLLEDEDLKPLEGYL